MKRVCALMAVYNEADIILETVSKLLQHDVDVFLIDNASTDGTAARVQHLVGHGLVDIEREQFFEDGREVYNWTALLKAKEALSRRLGYDWYLHVDADEIRLPPWPGLSLREGIDRVDAAGFNLINFKLYNFRLTEGLVTGPDFESTMLDYSHGERFNQRQVKAWQASPAVDLATFGGHHVSVPDARVFPTRFIHKHYPVRSLEHGRRKIIAERRARFSNAERARGWHVQYDDLNEVDDQEILWDPSRLARFDLHAACLELLAESNDIVAHTLATGLGSYPIGNDAQVLAGIRKVMSARGVDESHAGDLLEVAARVATILLRSTMPPLRVNALDGYWLKQAVQALADARYLRGDPSLHEELDKLSLTPIA